MANRCAPSCALFLLKPQGIDDKLLHQPTVRVKELAANSEIVNYETTLQELFGLDDDPQPVKVDLDMFPDAAKLATITTEIGRAHV